MFGKITLAEAYLTAPAKPASATNRVQINTELLSSLQDRRADRKPATFAGWGKNDKRRIGH